MRRCLEQAYPGNTLAKLHNLSVQLLSEGLRDLGILPGVSLDDIQRGLYRWGVCWGWEGVWGGGQLQQHLHTSCCDRGSSDCTCACYSVKSHHRGGCAQPLCHLEVLPAADWEHG